jgi:hypothetical protein
MHETNLRGYIRAREKLAENPSKGFFIKTLYQSK